MDFGLFPVYAAPIGPIVAEGAHIGIVGLNSIDEYPSPGVRHFFYRQDVFFHGTFST
jgi:hypothetical protein